MKKPRQEDEYSKAASDKLSCSSTSCCLLFSLWGIGALIIIVLVFMGAALSYLKLI